MPIAPTQDLGRIADELAIRTLQQNYFHSVDSKDWQLFASVFDERSIFDFREATDPPVPVLEGGEAIIQFVRDVMAEFTTVHHGFLRELEFEGSGQARALWAMEDILWRGQPGQLTKALQGFGHYHAEYCKLEGAWRISKIRLTRTFVETW